MNRALSLVAGLGPRLEPEAGLGWLLRLTEVTRLLEGRICGLGLLGLWLFGLWLLCPVPTSG